LVEDPIVCRSFVILLTAVASFVGIASVSSACTCLPSSDFYPEYMASDAIFLGEVTEISSAAPERPYDVWVTFRVEAYWKGEASATTQLLTADNSASCGYPFVVGTRYLVYATILGDEPTYGGLPAPGALSAHLCSRTHPTWPDDPDVDLLDSGPPSPSHFVLAMGVNPNPSHGPARVAWTIPGPLGGQARARVDVLDSQGRRLATLADGLIAPGPHQMVWDGRDSRGRLMPAGFYWVRLACAGQLMSRKLVRIAGRP
jgi:hypothetical protein